MAAFAATDVTVVASRENAWLAGTRRFQRGTITFGDGALTYPTGGIPLPAKEKFGFGRALESLTIFGLNGLTANYVYAYDPTNHKLQLFEEEAVAAGGPLLEADTAEAPAARTLSYLAVGS